MYSIFFVPLLQMCQKIVIKYSFEKRKRFLCGKSQILNFIIHNNDTE